jgi:hypothetical protein
VSSLENHETPVKLVVARVCKPSWWVDSICRQPVVLVEVQEALYRLALDATLVMVSEEFENKRQYKLISHRESTIILGFEWLEKVMLQ